MSLPLVGTFLTSLLLPIFATFAIGLIVFRWTNRRRSQSGISRKRSSSESEGDDDRSVVDPVDQEEPTGGDSDHEHDEDDVPFVAYRSDRSSLEEMSRRSAEFYESMNKRRTIRAFSDEHVPLEIIENCIRTAGTSPSGAHTEPWTYAVVSDPELKRSIREIVEVEEELNYKKRMRADWVEDLRKFRTDWNKPYLTEAPYLIVVFKQTHSFDAKRNNRRREHYYHEISTSISVGILLTALQNVGLCTLTSTPMNAGPEIRRLLGRPNNEKVLLLLPVGFPARDCQVPDLKRKPLDEIMITYD